MKQKMQCIISQSHLPIKGVLYEPQKEICCEIEWDANTFSTSQWMQDGDLM